MSKHMYKNDSKIEMICQLKRLFFREDSQKSKGRCLFQDTG